MVKPADMIFGGERSKARDTLSCVEPPFGCGRPLHPEEVEEWDQLTQKEYTLSYLCNTCQDEVFGAGASEEG